MKRDVSMRLVKLLNILLIAIPFAICWYGYFRNTVIMFPSVYRSAGIVLMFVVLFCFFASVYDAFLISLKRVSEMFYSQSLAILMADAFMFLILWLMSAAFPNLLPALGALVGQLALSAVWCKFTHAWFLRYHGGQKTGVIYSARVGLEDLFSQYGLDKSFDVRLVCTVEESLEKNLEMLEGLDSVFLCGVHSADRNVILKHCISHGIEMYIIPRIGDVIMSGAQRMHMFHLPILRVGRYSPNPEFLIAKRLFDVLVSAVALVVLSPVMLITAIAIKAYDGGPVFYKQVRLTKNGKEFNILKFRSMVVNAEADGVARLSTGDRDNRITPVGRIIRACRVDELPQLFNILGGSMSIVGPRPERPEIAAQYEKEMPEFALRLQAKAGLTGYAQVYGKYNTIPYDKLQMDLMYIAKPSFIEDLRIVFATIMILFMKESTEGYAQDSVASAMKGKESQDRKSA